MIQKGDMVGFEFQGEQHLAIVIEDLGKGYPYGRYTAVLVGGNGDHIPLSECEITLLSTKSQLKQWERKKNLKNLLDKRK